MPYTTKGKCVYKKDTGKKVGCTKGSVKDYLAALHANANESINENQIKLKFTKPNFDNEWMEAVRYPEFKEMGKESWIQLANNGTTKTYSEIKDVLGNVDLNFDNLEEPKKERFIHALSNKKVETPIAVKFSDNDYDLVAGNTRVSGLVNNGITDFPIWIVDISQFNNDEVLNESFDAIENNLSQKYDEYLDGLDIYENKDSLIVSKIVIKPEFRDGGVGSKIMQELADYADANAKIIALTPSSDFGGNKNRLIQFYKRFGFKHNKGHYKSFQFRDSMIRYPKMNSILNEVNVINPDIMAMAKAEPLKDSDTIRVYHGFNSYEDAIMAVKFGLSGKERARRIYSYESNNNPKGLFVTLDFKTAKKFVSPTNKRGISVIMELSVKVSDLEAPVWPSGSYTVQGQMSQNWKDAEDRHVNGTLKARENASKSEFPFISQADRPEVAASLMGPERQALFTGDINPNMIKTIFFSESGRPGHFGKRFERISPKEFLNKFESHEPEENPDGRTSEKGYQYYSKQSKHFQPNEDFSMEKLDAIVKKKRYSQKDGTELIQDLNMSDNLDLFFYPKQIQQIKDMGIINENKKKSNNIKGGKADKMSKKDIASKFGVTLSKIEKELRMGIKVEKEHTGSQSMAEEIAMDHLVEIPDYYTRLKKMEKEGEKHWEKKINESMNSYLKRALRENIDLSVTDETAVSTDYNVMYNGRNAGILMLSTHNSNLPDDAIELVLLKINEDYRGLKLGYQLIKEIWKQNPDIRKIYLMPTTQSRGFWEKMGARRLNDTYSVITRGHS
jgi:GNAT superfamily N-acetyltransferase